MWAVWSVRTYLLDPCLHFSHSSEGCSVKGPGQKYSKEVNETEGRRSAGSSFALLARFPIL